MGQWIDYKKLKESTDIRVVLEHYSIEVKVKGDQAKGDCPLPGHEADRQSRSLSVNLTKGVFRCFGCGAQGNVIDLVAYMEGLNPKNKRDFRTAAGKLQSIVSGEPIVKRSGNSTRQSNVVVNAPLDFQLKGLDPTHPWFTERGLTRDTVEHFGLGYCSRGYLKGRIAIPLHGADGNLIGYAGRIVDDSMIDGETPKYLFPKDREREGKRYQFQKSLVVYNDNQITAPVDDLIVVVGFTSVWWLWQAGFRHVVALMEDTCSDTQAQLIRKYARAGSLVRIMVDSERCALGLFKKVAPFRLVRWIRFEDGKQPTDFDLDRLRKLVDVGE